MSAHTPGPWSIRRFGTIPGAIVGGVMRRYTNGDVQDQLATVSAVQPENGGDGAMEANANLMVASPDLLAAAKWALDFVAGLTTGCTMEEQREVHQRLSAAIAKAEGRS